jgi:hypothetical protein
MFERITATKWKLTKDSREQYGALLVYMRNEWIVAASGSEEAHPNSCSEVSGSTAKNYRKMVECIDRLLVRLDGSFDAHRMAHAYGILSAALTLSPTGRLSRQALDKAGEHYGTMGLDSSRSGIDNAGNNQLACPPGS